MALIDDNLLEERPNEIGGVQRLYKYADGHCVSMINAKIAHHYEFAWEAAVFSKDGRITYATPLTSDVEVFVTDDEANVFLVEAELLFGRRHGKLEE